MITGRMPALVKGAGYVKPGGNRPLSDEGDIFRRSMTAEKSLRRATKTGLAAPDQVRKGLNPAFTNQFGMFMSQTPSGSAMSDFVAELNRTLSAELGKSITLTTPLNSGFVPFDLVAPSRLIYPVYSPLRNKLPRVPGQGTSHRAKVITGISGSQTAGLGAQDISMGEFPNGQNLTNNWPLNLPGQGDQVAVDINVPYKFFGRTEALSWLAQFAGQGFEDISSLANLILLQEFMLGEEYQIPFATGTNITAPSVAPTGTPRAAGSSETPLSGVTTDVYIVYTYTNMFGETVASPAATVAWSSGDVIDVNCGALARGATAVNVYVGTGAANPGRTGQWLFYSNVGGSRITLQGALPTSGTNPPTADSGTGASTRYEGMISILDGHASSDAGVYPSGFQAGYFNEWAGTMLNHEVIFTALRGLWDGNGAYRADPTELLGEGGDLSRLADEILTSSATNYRLFIQQSEVGGMRAGAAVSEFQNPITRSIISLVVHPWWTQGTVILNSYTLPMPWTNVSNIWENVMVQDYLSVSWPVIDASFRYSIFMFGALLCYAPQYVGLIKGLSVSDSTPYS